MRVLRFAINHTLGYLSRRQIHFDKDFSSMMRAVGKPFKLTLVRKLHLSLVCILHGGTVVDDAVAVVVAVRLLFWPRAGKDTRSPVRSH